MTHLPKYGTRVHICTCIFEYPYQRLVPVWSQTQTDFLLSVLLPGLHPWKKLHLAVFPVVFFSIIFNYVYVFSYVYMGVGDVHVSAVSVWAKRWSSAGGICAQNHWAFVLAPNQAGLGPSVGSDKLILTFLWKRAGPKEPSWSSYNNPHPREAEQYNSVDSTRQTADWKGAHRFTSTPHWLKICVTLLPRMNSGCFH